MSKRRRKGDARPSGVGRWAMALAAYGIGVACVVVGVLVLVFGGHDPRVREQPIAGSVTRLGVGLILLGLLATAIIGYLHWTKTRR